MRLSPAELEARASALAARLRACDLCPRRCGVDRLAGERGFCGAAEAIPLAAAVAHTGEEPPISGRRGAGTLFFGGCNLRCVYCQNHPISRLTIPVPEHGPDAVADAMLRLQAAGCHNIEWVTPTHLLPMLLVAWGRAHARGLRLPLVYNSGGYEALDVLRLLAGIVDVYLPDLKFVDPQVTAELAEAPDYWDVARVALAEMLRQVGPLTCDAQGIARRGVIVRHLVLPNDLAGSEIVLAHLARLEPRPTLALMAQFFPLAECEHPLLQRTLHAAEYARVRERAAALGLTTGWIQELSAERELRPDFRRPDPF